MDHLVEQALSELKARATKELVAKAMEKIVLASTFFANPGINRLTLMAVEWVVNYLMDEGEVLAFYGYTTYTVRKQKDEVLNAIANHQAVNDTTSRLALIARARDLIKLRP